MTRRTWDRIRDRIVVVLAILCWGFLCAVVVSAYLWGGPQ